MKMHLQAPENLPNAKFSRGLYPWGGGSKNAEAGWQLRRRKICVRCLREDKLVRQIITFWHDQGGKYNANKTRMKANELKKLTFVRPFHLVGLSVHDRPHNTRGQVSGERVVGLLNLNDSEAVRQDIPDIASVNTETPR